MKLKKPENDSKTDKSRRYTDHVSLTEVEQVFIIVDEHYFLKLACDLSRTIFM